MGFFKKLLGMEERADNEVHFDDALLQALLGTAEVSRDTALQVPTVSGGIDLIAGIISGTPIKLYQDKGGKAVEVRDDYRIALLNDDTGDTLNANEFWRAMIRDYYLGKGGYAYIRKERGRVKSLHYVDEREISIQLNNDPVFKDFDIRIRETGYKPWDFLKILRNTKNGAEGVPITAENSRLIAVSYQQLLLEYSMSKRGGNKKGFLKSEHRIDEASMAALKEAWKNLSEGENMMVLNNGIEFKESSDTAAEMQLDENKRTNAAEFAKIFHVSPEAVSGSSQDVRTVAKLAAVPLMQVIQCALNRDLLLEKEKKEYYFAFDTKELLKGDIRERFEAYKTALDANFMQIDEVRYAEDLAPLGLTWIKLGLQDVLYDPKTKQIYTPNTNMTNSLHAPSLPEADKEEKDGNTGEKVPDALNKDAENGTMESRTGNARFIQNRKTGLMEGSEPSGDNDAGNGGKDAPSDAPKKRANPRKKNSTGNKYSPSPRRNSGGIDLPPKKYSKLCGIMGTQHPNTKKGQKVSFRDETHIYFVTADGYGGFTLNRRVSNSTGRKK